jgi:hypothetical protein
VQSEHSPSRDDAPTRRHGAFGPAHGVECTDVGRHVSAWLRPWPSAPRARRDRGR